MRAMKVGAYDGICALVNRRRKARATTLCPLKIKQEHNGLQVRNRALTRSQPGCHPNISLSSLQNCKKLKFIFLLTSLWYFVIAAQADENITFYPLSFYQQTPIVYKNLESPPKI